MYGGGCVSVERWGVGNMRLKETSTADQAYSAEKTITLGELQDFIAALVEKHGRDYEVRVDTTYDQGQRFMAITAVEVKSEGYVALVA